MVSLQTVEIPGFREAVRKETRLRDAAFLDGTEIVCSIEVRPLSLRRVVWLEQAMNGFMVPCRFESENEMLAHALQVLYFCQPSYAAPTRPAFSFWRTMREQMSQRAFCRKALRAGTAKLVIEEIEAWLNDSFMDAPKGGGGEVMAPSYASFPAYIADKFGEAGLPFVFDEIMDMPLRRLWQHYRVAVRRVDGASISNPSDDLAVAYLGGRN